MPALQVRDFPQDLYERLKKYAASQHRSLSQQTIVAVQEMLERNDAKESGTLPFASNMFASTLFPERVLYAPKNANDQEVAERSERRRKALETMDRIKPKRSTTTKEIVDLVREGRDELDEHADRCIRIVGGLDY